ncbi:MAG: thaumatin family protein, partial [Pseudomonadota bacterium]
CKTAICPTGGCAANTGPTGPVTLAEFTLQNNAQDYYDVSVINGINVPMSMAPTAVTGVSSVYAPSGNEGDYWCGAPGSTSAANTLLASSWNVGANASSSQLPFYRYVDTTGFGQACNGNGDPACPTDSVCGLSYDPTGTQGEITQNQCGKLIGWWTADEICGVNPDGFSFDGIDCTSTLSVPSSYPAGSYPDAPRQVDVLLCQRNPNAAKGVLGTFNNSCYTAGATGNNCCGCQNWSGITNTGSCVASNKSWQKYSEPWLKPLKTAVPTAYSYPYDDKSSTFTCYQEATANITVPTPQQANETDYTITFCPGGTDISSFQ